MTDFIPFIPDRTPSRRAVMAALSAALSTGLAGCSGGGTDDGSPTATSQPVAAELVTARERMNALATDLARYVENGDVRFDDIDASQQLEDANAALQSAADAIETAEGEAQLETLVTLLDVFDGVIRALATVVGEGLSRLGDALAAHERTQEHFVEVELNEEGDVLNPGEMAGMMCGQLGELRDANAHLTEATGLFEESGSKLTAHQETFAGMESEVEALSDVDAATVQTAIDGAIAMATAMQELAIGLNQEVNGEVATHEGGLMWTWSVSPNATGAYDCENGTYSISGAEDLEADIRPRYVEARDRFTASHETLSEVDVDPLSADIQNIRQSFLCVTDYAADATQHRIDSIDALLEGDKETYADHVHAAFDLEETAAEEC